MWLDYINVDRSFFLLLLSLSLFSVAPWLPVPTLKYHETTFYSPDKELVTKYTLHLGRNSSDNRAKLLISSRELLQFKTRTNGFTLSEYKESALF